MSGTGIFGNVSLDDDARAKSQIFLIQTWAHEALTLQTRSSACSATARAFINIIGGATLLLGLDLVIPERRPKAASDTRRIPTGLRSVRERRINVGVSTTSPWRALSVTGTVGFDGLAGSTGAGSLCLDGSKQVVYNSCLSSTRETKHDITPLSLDDLAIVNALEPVSFIYKNGDGRTRYGFIAEDAEAVDAHLATYNASGTLTASMTAPSAFDIPSSRPMSPQ